MAKLHPKSIRRTLLEMLYEAYFRSPLEMLSPSDLVESGQIAREDLVPNIYYLGDRGLVELMKSYAPPMFSAARITAAGIDLVENTFEFNLRFPAIPTDEENAVASVPLLIEKLVEEADLSPLDGEARKCLLRDIQFLRDELSRPVERWRGNVIRTFIRWIDAYFKNANRVMPSLGSLRLALRDVIIENDPNSSPSSTIPFPQKEPDAE